MDDPDDRRFITAFARWDRIARIRRRARGKPISASTADITQTQIAKAMLFLAWLKDQGETLAICRQPHSWIEPPRLPSHCPARRVPQACR
ncbi:hypothetical protein ACQEVG_37025 [Streptomyces sp. CA-135486]|uniref:hypothetical protein n=1 Tax=Streptomyces sp. CA-135486 TaxID=3240049 RepID=UPI003D8FAC6F